MGGTDFEPAVQPFLLMRAKLFERRARRGWSEFPRADLACEHRGEFDLDAILAKANFSTSELLAELRRALPKRAGD